MAFRQRRKSSITQPGPTTDPASSRNRPRDGRPENPRTIDSGQRPATTDEPSKQHARSRPTSTWRRFSALTPLTEGAQSSKQPALSRAGRERARNMDAFSSRSESPESAVTRSPSHDKQAAKPPPCHQAEESRDCPSIENDRRNNEGSRIDSCATPDYSVRLHTGATTIPKPIGSDSPRPRTKSPLLAKEGVGEVNATSRQPSCRPA
jgi:hypothetical protein